MKRAMIYGDMLSESTSEQYPTVTLCKQCIEEEEKKEEDSRIVSFAGKASTSDGPCEWCGETRG